MRSRRSVRLSNRSLRRSRKLSRVAVLFNPDFSGSKYFAGTAVNFGGDLGRPWLAAMTLLW